jgi:hypothetical protein
MSLVPTVRLKSLSFGRALAEPQMCRCLLADGARTRFRAAAARFPYLPRRPFAPGMRRRTARGGSTRTAT